VQVVDRETSTALHVALASATQSTHGPQQDRSPSFAHQIDVCVCSYKRNEIISTLAALSRQEGLEGFHMRVVVADNTADGEMRGVIAKAAADYALDLAYISAPADNISVARNACLENVQADWVAFLDDDEVPTPGWLRALVDEAKRGAWDAVLGPVKAVYGNQTPRWIRQGDFNSTGPVWVHGKICTAYTGNIIFRRDFAERLGLRFRLELGKCGGEDEEFFSRFFDAGGRIGFSRDAVVFEPVQSERATMRWLLKRSFRSGQSYGGRLSQKTKRHGLEIARAFGKVAVCLLGAVLCSPRRLSRNRFLVRGALHLGVVTRLMGLREINIY